VSTEDEPVIIVQSGRGAQVRKAKIKTVKVVDVMELEARRTKLTEYTKA
jgi:topoisomerase-4 subunit A